MWRHAAPFIAAFIIAPGLWAAGGKEYPVTLKLLETDAISYKADGTKTTTNCTTAGPNDITCTSTQVPGGLHTELVSVVEASDGNTYVISCVQGAGGRFLSGAGQAMQANAGLATVSGCRVPPGTYRARWDKGRLKVLHEKGGKSKEVAFAILRSVPTAAPPAKPEQEAGVAVANETILQFSSDPTNADIELDGSFVGQTPSSILVAPGEHTIKITKSGYEPWKKELRTSGGQATVSAVLEPQKR
jgi:hypothetical protein